MRYGTLRWAALLWILPAAALAQQQDMLHLTSARTSPSVRQQLKDDWRSMPHDREWAYCVTGWSVAFTEQRDTVYVVEDVKLVRGVDVTRHSVESFKQLGCEDGASGRLLPILHVHPAGDCTPSRADVLVAIVRRRAPFQMILCGEESTVSYSGGVYEDASLYRFSKSFDVVKYNKP